MYYKFSGFAQRLVGATAAAAYSPQVTPRTRARAEHRASAAIGDHTHTGRDLGLSPAAPEAALG